MNTRPGRKLLHIFDRKNLLLRRFRRFMALEKTHTVFRQYAQLTDLLVSGKRLAGSVKALIKVNVQNTELHSFGFIVRRQRHADPRPPLEVLFDLLRNEGQWLRVLPGDPEAAIRAAINGVLDARSYHASLHRGAIFPPSWSGPQILAAILESELAPAGFALARLEPADDSFSGTVVLAGQDAPIEIILDQLREKNG